MSAVPEAARRFFRGAIVEGVAEMPVGSMAIAILVGPTEPNSFGLVYGAPIQSASVESWPAIGTGFGSTTNFSSRPMCQDWLICLPADMPPAEIALAMVASRCGFPVWCLVEVQGAYHSADSPPDSPPRTCCRPFTGGAIYGSDGHQTTVPPTIMSPFTGTPIQEQNRRFLAAMAAECDSIYTAFFTWLESPSGQPYKQANLHNPTDHALQNSCSDSVAIIAFGGFGTDGGAVSWAVRDCLPMALHILKHRLRAGQGRAVCHGDHVPMPSMPPKVTMEAAHAADVLRDIRAVRAYETAMLPAWDFYVRNQGLLPLPAVAVVMDYFTRAHV